MLLAVADAVRRPVVARGHRHRDSDRRSLGEDLFHLRPRLLRPGILGAAPADRHDRRFVRGVVHRRREGVDEALVGIRSEVDGDFGTGRHGAEHLDVQHHLPVGVLIGARRVHATVDADRGHGRRGGQPEALEVAVEIGLAEPTAQLQDRRRLPRAVDARREAVRSRDLRGRVGLGRGRALAQMRPRLWPFVDPEDAGDDPRERARNRQRSAPAAVLAGGRVSEHAQVLRSERLGDRVHGAAQRHGSPCLVDSCDFEAGSVCERTHGGDVLVARAGGLGELLARHRPSLRRRSIGLLIDPVERPRRPQVNRHLDRLVVVDVSHARVVRRGLSVAPRDLHTVRHDTALLVERSEDRP